MLSSSEHSRSYGESITVISSRIWDWRIQCRIHEDWRLKTINLLITSWWENAFLSSPVLILLLSWFAIQLAFIRIWSRIRSGVEPRLLRSFQKPSLSPLYESCTSIRKFFSPANRTTLYAGMWTRVGWSVLSCSMGIVFGSALLTKSFRDKNQ